MYQVLIGIVTDGYKDVLVSLRDANPREASPRSKLEDMKSLARCQLRGMFLDVQIRQMICEIYRRNLDGCSV